MGEVNKKQEVYFDELTKWCIDNINKINFEQKDDIDKYEKFTRNIMENKIGKIDNNEAKTLAEFLSKKAAYKVGLDYTNIIKDDFNSETIEKIKSCNPGDILLGLQEIYYNIAKVYQEKIVTEKTEKFTKKMYLIALESVCEKANPNFYIKNSRNLLKENSIKKTALKLGVKTIKKYNKEIYKEIDKDKLEEKYEEYKNDFFRYDDDFYGKASQGIEHIDWACFSYIENNPDILNKYPILKLGYNDDGSKKNIETLLQDRQNLIENKSKDKQKIDPLYNTIMNQTYSVIEGMDIKKDIESILNYVEKTNNVDEYIYCAMELRLNRINCDKDEKSKYLKPLREKIEQKEISELVDKKTDIIKEYKNNDRLNKLEESVLDEIGKEINLNYLCEEINELEKTKKIDLLELKKSEIDFMEIDKHNNIEKKWLNSLKNIAGKAFKTDNYVSKRKGMLDFIKSIKNIEKKKDEPIKN